MKVALLGNPNTGKSSIFNLLTGLRQHVGNFPGVTVDRKVGKLTINGNDHEIVDFPGTYSIYPRSNDEKVVYDALSSPENRDYPDVICGVIDASNLERNLLLFSQLYDLGIPIVMILNMTDVLKRRQKSLDLDQLMKAFPEATVVESNARIGFGKERILEAIETAKPRTDKRFLQHGLAEYDNVGKQEEETTERFNRIRAIIPKIEKQEKSTGSFSKKLDKLLIHPILGYAIFALTLLIIFQFIYVFASVPMDFIDHSFALLTDWAVSVLPAGVLTDLITQGIIPGIGGVLIFIPQIALLFLFISILEETGYLSRVVFIMDRILRPLGLNGKSVVPLMSSVACAIPGVMAARTIPDWKERIITIMVAPLMSCSARIPVYTILIALVVPDEKVGWFNLQGLTLFGLYALGTVSALLIAFVLKLIVRTKDKGFLLMEMPSYKLPRWKNVGLTVLEKIKVFVWDAGRVILAISIVLWAMATYGPSDRMEVAAEEARKEAIEQGLSEGETNQKVASAELENSFIGILGKTIEPAIEPLGYDWKIGISLITSFAAREVFVGSMATIYAVEDDGEENRPLLDKMRAEKRADGTPVYTFAVGLGLMVFYAFAMQCMSTVAIVKRETNSWKWPLIQMGYMGVLAYVGAFITYIIAR